MWVGERISKAINNFVFEALLAEPMDQGESDNEQEQPQCNQLDVQRNSTRDVNSLSKNSNTLMGFQQQLEQNGILGAAESNP